MVDKTKTNESEEFVDFSTIKNLIEITDESLFQTYLTEIYKDLVDRTDSNKKQGIGKITFYDYMKIQIFISEKLFLAFDKDNDGFLSQKELIDGMTKLYFGSFKQTCELIFNLLDFDKDGLINKGDIKITMSYLPLNDTTHKYQMESLKEIDEILNLYFDKSKTLKFDAFLEKVQKVKSDIYLQLLCFLYENKPFSKYNVEAYKNFKKRKTTSESPERKKDSNNQSPSQKNRESVLLSSPSKKSKLAPVNQFLGLNLEGGDEDDIKLLSKIKKKGNVNDENLNYDEMIRLPNNTNEQGSLLDSPTKFLRKRPEKVETGFSLTLTDMSKENTKPTSKNSVLSDYSGSPTKKKQGNKTFVLEDVIYKITENNNIKKYYLSIIGKDIYYYKSELKEELQGMHNLTGCFVKEVPEVKNIDGKQLYGIEVIFTNKSRMYYTISKEARDKWMAGFKESIGYQTFTDIYNIDKNLGEGKFGLVKLGIHKKTGEKVAIKIIKKNDMDQKDLELVRSEIDIMKLCKHKNVVRLLDHFENSEYIFIVMEYLAGGDLGNYSKKKKYTILEEEAVRIIYQITLAIEYLHKYGVVHRDLKPDNIMLSEANDTSSIKLMDFGLSKILGPQEKVSDGFGTLSFVAPEVLVRKPYNKEVDIWSIGITAYYIMTGTLPFDDEEDNEEKIAKQIVFNKLTFYDKKWSKISDICKDFIESCLIKEPEKRFSAKDLLNHEWLKNYAKKLNNLDD